MAHFIRFALISLEKTFYYLDRIKVPFYLTNSYPLHIHLYEYLHRFLKNIFGKGPKPFVEIFGKTNVVWKVFQQLGKVVFKKPDSKENHHYISNFRKSYQQIISYFTKSRLCNSFSQVKWSSGMLSSFFWLHRVSWKCFLYL